MFNKNFDPKSGEKIDNKSKNSPTPIPNSSKVFSDLEQSVMFQKSTEAPRSNKFDKFFESGIYVCKNCETPLYSSKFKFDSGCGWPAFDDEFEGAILKQKDSDKYRVEILCNNCGIHLGHVFSGEHLTSKNLRHCVNSASMEFVDENDMNSDSRYRVAILAAGCFWGVEFYLAKLNGVLTAESGYCGGNVPYPSYKEICTGTTEHLESVKVVYDSQVLSYEDLIKYFFEIHDFEQSNGQGNDIGSQYISAIFVQDGESNYSQNETVEAVIKVLESKNYKVATKILPFARFYSAEDYHQDYYTKNGGLPYCHSHRKIF
jgi:peptide methionine sulfoxide reductase msrA/msrB